VRERPKIEIRGKPQIAQISQMTEGRDFLAPRIGKHLGKDCGLSPIICVICEILPRSISG
jgi:hypothetical protein